MIKPDAKLLSSKGLNIIASIFFIKKKIARAKMENQKMTEPQKG